MQLTFWTEEPSVDGEPEDSEGAWRGNIGRAGEYIVAAELELAGFPCSHAAEGLSYDLIAQTKDGSLCRIQVKAASVASRPDTRQAFYRFKSKNRGLCDYENVDVFAFVALDKRVATFARAAYIQTRSVFILERDFADTNLRALSLSQALATSTH